MTTAAVRAHMNAVDNTKQPKEPPKNVLQLLQQPATIAQMKKALPSHLTAERMARIALTEVRRIPKLAKCEQTSFMGAIMTCCQLGLEPGAALGHAYLLPYENRKKGIVEAQLILGYRGMIDLARRSGQIRSIEARTIHAKDRYRIEFGLHAVLEHQPAWEEEDRGPMMFVYAVAHLKDGGTQFEVLSRADCLRIKAKVNPKPESPWNEYFDEMAKKSAVRRLFKMLPVSVEMQRAVVLDEMAEAGVSQVQAFTDVDYTGITHEVSQDELVKNIREQIQSAGDEASLNLAANVIDSVEAENDRVFLLEEFRKRREQIVGTAEVRDTSTTRQKEQQQ